MTTERKRLIEDELDWWAQQLQPWKDDLRSLLKSAATEIRRLKGEAVAGEPRADLLEQIRRLADVHECSDSWNCTERRPTEMCFRCSVRMLIPAPPARPTTEG